MSELELSFSKLVCYKCRSLLVDKAHENIIDTHSEKLTDFSRAKEEGKCETSLWYLKDDGLPEWIKQLVEQSGWTKGRVSCPSCKCGVGGFDYVGGDRCPCPESRVLPPVQFTRSKVDLKVATLV